jgi:hypothetical protein
MLYGDLNALQPDRRRQRKFCNRTSAVLLGAPGISQAPWLSIL